MVAMALPSDARATVRGRPILDARRIRLPLQSAIGFYMVGPYHTSWRRQFAHDLYVGILGTDAATSGLTIAVERRCQIQHATLDDTELRIFFNVPRQSEAVFPKYRQLKSNPHGFRRVSRTSDGVVNSLCVPNQHVMCHKAFTSLMIVFCYVKNTLSAGSNINLYRISRSQTIYFSRR
jgi:hypothetical protein